MVDRITCNFYINGTKINILLSSNHEVIKVDNADDLQRDVQKLNETVKQYNMKISINKTQVLSFEGNDTRKVKTVVNKMTEQMLHFTYLGFNVGSKKHNDTLIETPQVSKPLLGKVQKQTVLKCYNVMVIPVSFHVSECWTLTKPITRTETAEMYFMKVMVGYNLTDKK
jgi:hypothetical protein